MSLYFCKFSLYGTFGYFFGMDAGIFFDCATYQVAEGSRDNMLCGYRVYFIYHYSIGIITNNF